MYKACNVISLQFFNIHLIISKLLIQSDIDLVMEIHLYLVVKLLCNTKGKLLQRSLIVLGSICTKKLIDSRKVCSVHRCGVDHKESLQLPDHQLVSGIHHLLSNVFNIHDLKLMKHHLLTHERQLN
jgi:hypothetical protein